MSDDVVETKMFTIFQLINDWLKFAEAKNLAIIALSGAACSALASYLASSQGLTPDLKRILWVAVFFFALSCVTSLLSFTPRTSQKNLLSLFPDWGAPSAEDNLYFYKDLGKYRDAGELAKKYRDLFSGAATQTATTTPASHQQLAKQIIVNSQIVVYKLRFFVVALLLSVIAIGTILGLLIYKVMVSS